MEARNRVGIGLSYQPAESIPGLLNCYLCTYDLYGPVRNAIDADRVHYEGNGRGLGPGNWDYFGPCEMASSRKASANWGPKKSRFPGPGDLINHQPIYKKYNNSINFKKRIHLTWHSPFKSMFFIGNGRRRVRPSIPFESEPKPEVGTFHKKMFANLKKFFVSWVVGTSRRDTSPHTVLVQYNQYLNRSPDHLCFSLWTAHQAIHPLLHPPLFQFVNCWLDPPKRHLCFSLWTAHWAIQSATSVPVCKLFTWLDHP